MNAAPPSEPDWRVSRIRLSSQNPGLNPWLCSANSRSKIGSMTLFVAVCTTRSVTVGMPNGFFCFALPSGSLRLAISTSFRFAAARFWNVNPSDWLGLVAALFEVLFDGEQPRAVHAAGPCVGLHLFPCQLQRV